MHFSCSALSSILKQLKMCFMEKYICLGLLVRVLFDNSPLFILAQKLVFFVVRNCIL